MTTPGSSYADRAERSGPLVVCTTQASADLVATMLAAHGIRSAGTWLHHLYPSLGWVEGFTVTVAIEQEAEARALLAVLSRDDVLEPPPEAL